MKELSIFVDESGDFGKYDPKAPFYIISLVIHNQKDSIAEQVKLLDRKLTETKLRSNFVHVGPLIRREGEYKNLTVDERLKILRRLVKFASKIEFRCKMLVVEKKHIKNTELSRKLTWELMYFLQQQQKYLFGFDKVKIYYDNGQIEVARILRSVFSKMFKVLEFKKATQKDYKMLQVADLICTIKLIELKMAGKSLSRSERRMLGSDRDIDRLLFRSLKNKLFEFSREV